jgi:hypothetical protein
MNDTFKRQWNDLPNEILLDIFQWIDARTLYNCFFNLNARLNHLLQSLTNLQLIIWSRQDTDHLDYLFSSRIQTLIVYCDALYTLTQFSQVRHLILIDSRQEQMSRAMLDGQQLRTISLISPRCFSNAYHFHEMIFSNRFPRLTSCYLTTVYSPSIEIRRLSWQQSPALRFLRISSCDALIHVAILAACPNLCMLHLSVVHLNRTPINSPIHRQLKQLTCRFERMHWPSDNQIFSTFFILVPNLQRLIVHRSATLPDAFNDLLEFDWLATIVVHHLPMLIYFKFYLHLMIIYRSCSNHFDNFIDQLKKNFFQYYRHHRRYALRIHHCLSTI